MHYAERITDTAASWQECRLPAEVLDLILARDTERGVLRAYATRLRQQEQPEGARALEDLTAVAFSALDACAHLLAEVAELRERLDNIEQATPGRRVAA